MTSFTDGFWNMLIFVGTVGSIIVLYLFTRNYSADRPPGEGVQSMGHKWDGDLEELNNPLPRWWLNMFYITMVWAVVYLLLYPGVGTHSMLLGWSQVKQYDEEMAAAEERYGPIFEKFMSEDIVVVARSPEALKIGRRLFVNYCASCHGSDAGGNPGFPNLRDADWLYGGTPEAIKTSIMNGRNGAVTRVIPTSPAPSSRALPLIAAAAAAVFSTGSRLRATGPSWRRSCHVLARM